MAEHTNGKPLVPPTDPPSESVSEQRTSIPNIDPNPSAEPMEVHHHSHAHGKKNWKAYLWEFLMLFLAVFCGFLAEYQLEHVIEHNREKEFIKSYIEDLKIDTASFTRVLNGRKKTMERLDSLMLLLKNKQIKGHENELYFFGRTLTRNITFRSTDRTIIQLKNSGSLRLIRNEKAADSIMSYEKKVDELYVNQDRERDERFNTYPILSRMFDPFVLDSMIDKDGYSFIRPSGNPPLRSYDDNIQLDLAFYVHQLKSSSLMLTSRMQVYKEKAVNIIVFLNKEYHLE